MCGKRCACEDNPASLNKKHGNAVFFCVHYELGRLPQTPTQRTFREKSFGISKASPKHIDTVEGSFCGFLRGFFKSLLKRRFGTAVPTITTNKKRGLHRVFSCEHYELGLSAPNPDTRNFSRKVSWNFKSFAKIKCVFLSKVLWHTFLRKKGVFFCLPFL